MAYALPVVIRLFGSSSNSNRRRRRHRQILQMLQSSDEEEAGRGHESASSDDDQQRQQPGRQQPGRQQPGRQQPGRQQPGRQQPGRQQPGRQQPSATSSRRPAATGERVALVNGTIADDTPPADGPFSPVITDAWTEAATALPVATPANESTVDQTPANHRSLGQVRRIQSAPSSPKQALHRVGPNASATAASALTGATAAVGLDWFFTPASNAAIDGSAGPSTTPRLATRSAGPAVSKSAPYVREFKSAAGLDRPLPPNDSSTQLFQPCPVDKVSVTSSGSSSLAGQEICRICHWAGEEPLIAPCRCSGSMKWVHQSCLQKWVQSSDTKSCELCRFAFVMTSRTKPFRRWRKLDMTTVERRKVLCSVTFHVIAITCVVWSLYVLIDRTAEEANEGTLEWPFWTKLIVVAVGFTGALVFMYVQCKMYAGLCKRWRAFNRIVFIQSLPDSTARPTTTAPTSVQNQRTGPGQPPTAVVNMALSVPANSSGCSNDPPAAPV